MRQPTMTALTPDEREDIESAGDAVETMVTAWRIVVKRHGQDWDELTTIDPTEYVMQKDDWLWIAGLLRDRTPGGDVDAVNGMLEWMNRGPSASD